MALVDVGRLTFDASAPIGQHYGVGRFDAEASAVPFQGDGALRTRYTVPAGKKLSLQAVQVVTDRSWCVPPGTAVRAGIATLRVNGVDKMEWAVYETGWYELPNGVLAFKAEQRRGGGINCWDVAFAPGDVLVLRFTPSNVDGCVAVSADLSGTSAGVAVCTADRETVLGTAAVDLITYTVPAGGFTLQRVCLQASVRGNPACPFVSLLVRGQLVAEFPTWRAIDSQGAPPRLAVQLHGLDLYPGDTIELRASSLWRTEEWASLLVLGELSDLAPAYPTLAAVTAAIPGIVLPGSPPAPSDPPTAEDYAWAVLQGVVA